MPIICPVPRRHLRRPWHQPPWGHAWDSHGSCVPALSHPQAQQQDGCTSQRASSTHLLLLGITKKGRTGPPGSHRLPGDYRAAECPSGPGPGAVRTLAFALCPCLFSLLLLHKGTNHHKKLHVLEALPLGHCLFPTRCLEGRATPAGNGIFDRVHTDNSKDASLQEEKQN